MVPDPTVAAAGMAEMLDTYGPWAVMSITMVAAIFVIWYIGKRVNKQLADMQLILEQKDRIIEQKDRLLIDTLEKRHDEFNNVLKETTNALITASSTNERLIGLLAQVKDALNK